MSQASAIGILRQLRDHLSAGAPLDRRSRVFLVDRLTIYLDQSGRTELDRVLGLRQRGGVSVAREKALLRRDELLRLVWKLEPAWRDQAPAAAARLMHLSALRYERLRWPRERDAVTEPPSEPAATWWKILALGLPIPRAKRLQQILQVEIQ